MLLLLVVLWDILFSYLNSVSFKDVCTIGRKTIKYSKYYSDNNPLFVHYQASHCHFLFNFNDSCTNVSNHIYFSHSILIVPTTASGS